MSEAAYKRFKTKRSGVTYRETNKGRTYYVYARGTQQKVEGGFEEACALQDTLRGKARRGEPVVSAKHTFAEAAEAAYELHKGRWNPRVARNYRASLDTYALPYFDGLLRSYDWESLVEFRLHLESEGLSGATIRNVLKPVRLAFTYARKKRWIESNPFADLEAGDGPKVQKREVRIPSANERAKLLSCASTEGLREFVELGFYGLRKGEILGLTWADFDGQALDVNKQWRTDGVVASPKTASSVRIVPLAPSTAKALTALKLKSKHSQESDPIFCSASGRHLLHSNVHRSWNRVREAAGLPELHFHDLRHVAASVLHDAGLSDAELAAAGGWANANLPKGTYTHVPDAEKAAERVREAIGSVVAG